MGLHSRCALQCVCKNMLGAGATAFLLSTSGALPLAARPRHEAASTVSAEPRPQEKSKPVVVERKAEDKELAPITAQQLAEDIHTKIPLAMTEEEVEATASQFGALAYQMTIYIMYFTTTTSLLAHSLFHCSFHSLFRCAAAHQAAGARGRRPRG